MDRDRLGDASCLDPVLEPELDLAWPKPAAVAGAEERRAVAGTLYADLAIEKSAKSGVEEHRLLSSPFGLDCHGSLGQVHITYVQGNERAKPDAGAEQEREHRVVSSGNRAVRAGNGAEESLRFVGRQVAGHSAVRRCRADEPGRVVGDVAGVDEEPEEDPQGCLCSIDRQRRPTTVPAGQKPSQYVGVDRCHQHVPAEPVLQLAQVPQVSLPGALAPTIGSELRVEACYGRGELHGFTSLRAGH